MAFVLTSILAVIPIGLGTTMTNDPLKIVTLNIHKGWSLTKRRVTVDQIKHCIRESGADIVCLQEVVGAYPEPAKKSQFEFLADGIWQHFAYGKNAIHSQGHHGNAILSKYPFVFYENHNISNHPLEQRGILHGVIGRPPSQGKASGSVEVGDLHVMTLHLDLTAWGRRRQIFRLCDLIRMSVPTSAPLIVCGDFNDWREQLSNTLRAKVGLNEAYLTKTGRHAKTFPTFLPLFKLDRIYFRNIELKKISRMDSPNWHLLSDHLGLQGEFANILS